ncbi:MAG: FMN-binding protein [Spirochaetaceae bacterium]|jgi:uncharacterized protein with FMN-binding domain|nr:FMN-binding protein [Spirochaetaceae bacterium]
MQLKMKRSFLLLASLVFLAAVVLAACASTRFKAGTYEGSAMGFHGTVTVKVTLSADKIVSVVAEGNETEGIGDKALQLLPPEIVAAQSIKIDAITGATKTSDAILYATEDALISAGIDPSKLLPVESFVQKNKSLNEDSGNSAADVGEDASSLF